jgi:hypothetical protein
MFEVKSVKIISEEIRITGAIISMNLGDQGSCIKITSGGSQISLDSKSVNFSEVGQAFAYLIRNLKETNMIPRAKRGRKPKEKEKPAVAAPSFQEAIAKDSGAKRVMMNVAGSARI